MDERHARYRILPGPRLEIPEDDGTYVLVDDGPRSAWRYVFVPNTNV